MSLMGIIYTQSDLLSTGPHKRQQVHRPTFPFFLGICGLCSLVSHLLPGAYFLVVRQGSHSLAGWLRDRVEWGQAHGVHPAHHSHSHGITGLSEVGTGLTKLLHPSPVSSLCHKTVSRLRPSPLWRCVKSLSSRPVVHGLSMSLSRVGCWDPSASATPCACSPARASSASSGVTYELRPNMWSARFVTGSAHRPRSGCDYPAAASSIVSQNDSEEFPFLLCPPSPPSLPCHLPEQTLGPRTTERPLYGSPGLCLGDAEPGPCVHHAFLRVLESTQTLCQEEEDILQTPGPYHHGGLL